MNRVEKHEFALYYKGLSVDVVVGNFLLIDDVELVRRVCSVLRLSVNDKCVLFSSSIRATCIISVIQKKSFSCKVIMVAPVLALQPSITLMLPLLKREALENVVYNATAMGVGVIQLVSTEKTAHWSGAKELDRLMRIAIAAAEQSKQFVLPLIIEPIILPMFLEKPLQCSIALHADVEGICFQKIISTFSYKESFLLSVGPEGDLTALERDLLLKAGFTFVRLTPSILKSENAFNVLIGIVRSFT